VQNSANGIIPLLSREREEGMKGKLMKTFIKSFAIIVVLFFGFSLFILSNQLAGFRSFIVQSGSMEPTIATGSLVITQYMHPGSLKQNDIITFLPPTKNREFVTHRITKASHQKTLSTFTTKGDNNQHEDTWTLAGGGVVGKVIVTIPYMGYLLAFSQSKLGILFFILLPAVYLIIGEVKNIVTTIKHHTRKQPLSQETAILCIALFLGSLMTMPPPTHALLADSAQLTGNTISVAAVSPTPTVIPSCGGNTSITVSNNGAGSTTTVTTTNTCQTTINQSNNTRVINQITTETDAQ
jgi:signal peptidase I